MGLGLALSGVLSAVALAAIATPPRFEARLAALDADTATAAQSLRKRPRGDILPPDAACPSAGPGEIQALRDALKRTAETFRLEQATVSVEADPAADARGLAALKVQLDGQGQYDAALGALQHLSTLRPMVFIEAVDLESKTSFVTLSIKGHAFCSAD
jgi:hypothetical protein